MSDDDGAASSARRDLVDKVAGRVKEVAGAIVDNDDLADRGRLQQAEAEKRREAEADETAASLEIEEAEQDIASTEAEADVARQDVEDRTDANEAATQNDRLRQHQEAEADAMRCAKEARIAAETQSERRMEEADASRRAAENAATDEISAAREDYDESLNKADALEREAAEARERAAQAQRDLETNGDDQ
ncbi:hypothetical protein [Rhodococcoides corynebacterioides]|uniref:hypothetical protein n=1 Tax=Rhodococcoides corynebacterioides TaxID=53972 RepID=UPI003AE505C5